MGGIQKTSERPWEFINLRVAADFSALFPAVKGILTSLRALFRKLPPSFANKVGFGFQPASPSHCLWNNPVALAQLSLVGVNCTSLPLLRKIHQILGHCLFWQKVFFIRAGAWQHQSWGHQPSCTVSHDSQGARENNYKLLEMTVREHADLLPKNSSIWWFPCNKGYIYLWKQYMG